MKAIAVYPGRQGSIHLDDLPMPGVDDVLDGRGVLGNKVAVGSVNANRTYFERGVLDISLAEAHYPGWGVC